MNTSEQVEWAKELGLRALLVNHNCWLDERVYRLTNEGESRPYDAVINSRPFRWKRVYLADLIESLAFIKGKDYTNGESCFWSPWYRTYEYVNLRPISDPKRIVELLNKSKMGLILSGSTGDDRQGNLEGACFSSSEYLLCGLPVVSTPSEGGRDLWYDENNSIICEPTRIEVFRAHQEMLSRIARGEIDRQAIRERHLDIQREMRMRFVESTRELFRAKGISTDADAVFRERFINRMTRYEPDIDSIVALLGESLPVETPQG
jgi:glycosyltransferase involved in cell wall biosynthesis